MMFKYQKKTIFILLFLVIPLFVSCNPQRNYRAPYLILYAFDAEGALLSQKMVTDTAEKILGRDVFIGEISGKPVILAESGVGMTNAALTAQKLLDLYKPKGVFFTGIAGAVDTSVSIGDIVICNRWLTHDYGYYGAKGFYPEPINIKKNKSDSSFQISYFKVDSIFLRKAEGLVETPLSFEKILDRLPEIIVNGVGVSGNSFIDCLEKRTWLSEHFQALVVDMETAAVAQVCTINDIPFIAFRSASDLAGGSGSSTATAELDNFFKVAAANSSRLLMKFIEELPD
ncbi:MAG: 5'-methylthioadenosine/S-adenosylhomocysteine nucleosidase [candidate division Zixibacteria bacterium]|nr:5'-methylthioadenosine/S-adenosylhomocysteine nucleosidase [candidate division Zixibacteria bacterium]